MSVYDNNLKDNLYDEMTIDEAIKVLRQHNVTGASVLRITRGQALEKDLLSQVLDSCEQFISEKAEYKRLLKAAVDDFDSIYCRLGDACEPMPDCDVYPFIPSGRACNCKWRYADEAIKLIGEE